MRWHVKKRQKNRPSVCYGDTPLARAILSQKKASSAALPAVQGISENGVDGLRSNALVQAILDQRQTPKKITPAGALDRGTGLDYDKKEIISESPKSSISQRGEPFDEARIVPLTLKTIETSPGLSNNRVMLKFYLQTATFVANESLKSPIGYDVERDVIVYNPKKGLPYGVDEAGILFHELAHRAAACAYKLLKNRPTWNSAIKAAEMEVMERAEEIQGWFSDGGKYEDSPFLSDIFSALSRGKIVTLWSHEPGKWESDFIRSNEIFANIAAIDALGLDRNEILNDIYEVFKEIIGEV